MSWVELNHSRVIDERPVKITLLVIRHATAKETELAVRSDLYDAAGVSNRTIRIVFAPVGVAAAEIGGDILRVNLKHPAVIVDRPVNVSFSQIGAGPPQI